MTTSIIKLILQHHILFLKHFILSQNNTFLTHRPELYQAAIHGTTLPNHSKVYTLLTYTEICTHVGF